MIRIGLVVSLAATIATLACGPTAPSTSSDNSKFEIRSDTRSLKVGESIVLAAFRLDGQRVSNLTWTSDRPDVCTITAEGLAIAVQSGVATVTATDRAYTASIGMQVVLAVQGDWIGQARLVEEKRISGKGPHRDSPRDVFPYQVKMQQIHDRITATDSGNHSLQVLTGTIDLSGVIRLAGSVDFPGEDQAHVDTDPWLTQVDGSGNQMKGEYLDAARFINFWGPQVIQYRVEIIGLVRKAP